MPVISRFRGYHKNTADATGTVMVKIYLLDPDQSRTNGRKTVKGNITKTFLVYDAKVSVVCQVFKSIVE